MLTILLFIAAIGIASISAYFSIFGLVALFSATPLAIIIAGSVTEFGKLALVSYFYQFKEYISIPFKFLLSFIVVTVMAVTSIGVFGFLSSSYLEHRTDQSVVQNQMERIDSKIERQKTKLERNEKVIDNLDQAYEQYLDVNYISKALKKRKEQKKEREAVKQRIREIEERLSQLRDDKANIHSKQQSVESQVGPIKYFAIAVYGKSEDSIDKAVRLLIILLIIILDPFAVTILVCANHASVHKNTNNKKYSKKSINEKLSKFKKRSNNDRDMNSNEANLDEGHIDAYNLTNITNNDSFSKDFEKEFSKSQEMDDNTENNDTINHKHNDEPKKQNIGSYSFYEENSNEENSNEENSNIKNDRWINR
ncbi:hypothetical protein PBI_SCTP2_195 [Salicola phage SCTP-2]|nr:hypothetical protein PBI_SCTP2_195 [Salicola phage SCTP-2]